MTLVLSNRLATGRSTGLVSKGDSLQKALNDLTDTRPEIQVHAAKMLEGIALTEPGRCQMLAAGVAKPLVSLLAGHVPEARIRAATCLDRLCCASACRVAVTAAGALAPLVKLLSGASDEGKELACKNLATLACTDKSRDKIIALGAVGPIVGLLAHPRATLAIRAASAVAALSTGNLKARDRAGILVEAGVLLQLKELMVTPFPPEERRALSRSLSRSSLSGELHASQAPTDWELVMEATKAVRCIANCNAWRALCIEVGIMVPLVSVMEVGPPNAQAEAASAVAAIATEDDVEVSLNACTDLPAEPQLIVLAGALPPLAKIITGTYAEAKAHAAHALFVLSRRDSLQALIFDSGCLPGLLGVFKEGSPQAKAWAAGTLRCLAVSAETREAIERAVPLGQAGRETFLKQIQSYCF